MKANLIITVACTLLVFVVGGATPASKNKSEQDISELRVRLICCEIGEQSPARDDDRLNHPPNLYVVVKKGSDTVATSSAKWGWKVKFTDNQEQIFNVVRLENTKYRFEVFDNQWGYDEPVAKVPISGKEIVEAFLPGLSSDRKRKQIRLLTAKFKVKLTLECVGVVRWYRLENVTIPSASPCRTAFMKSRRTKDEKPQLQVRIFRDGRPLASVSGGTNSTYLPEGWEGTFPITSKNCWMISEQSESRYDVEVWDIDELNELLFKTSGLKGEDFRGKEKNSPELIFEKVDDIFDSERRGRVRFKPLSGPVSDR